MIICMLDAGQFIEKPEFLEPLKQYGEIRIFSGMPKSVDEVVARAGDAEVVAFAVTQLTHEIAQTENSAVYRHRYVEFRRCGLCRIQGNRGPQY